MSNAQIAGKDYAQNVRKGISRYFVYLVFRKENVVRFGGASSVCCFSSPCLS
ncbi:hypothetical protein HMPREF0649_01032 [Segatella buccae D17]|nr:hypothetical protein HMPREF0649_01032 [Segatella buccae D17]